MDDNAAQAGYVVVQPTTVTGGVTHTLTSEGADASEDGTGRGAPIVVQSVNENQRGEVTLTDQTSPLSGGGGKPGQGYPCIVQPLALRGREGGAQLEIGPEGGPYNALRAGDGGSSRQSLVAITAPAVAATLTAGTSTPGVSAPGRRQEDDHNLVAFMHTAGIDPQCSEVVSPTIKAGHDTMPSVMADMIVRRLTELECERLQGYPDGWTDRQSGSARYRQLGNSIAVPVFEWVARRLVAVDESLGVAS